MRVFFCVCVCALEYLSICVCSHVCWPHSECHCSPQGRVACLGASVGISMHRSSELVLPARFSTSGSVTRRSSVDAVNEAEVGYPNLPIGKVDISGPAATVLRLVHDLSLFVVLRYSLSTIEADAFTLLRMQRYVKSNFAEIDVDGNEGRDAGVCVSSQEATYEALERMRGDFGQLRNNLESLGDAARQPTKVLEVLRSEVRSAHRQLILLLRLSKGRCLRDGALRDFAQMMLLQHYVEGSLPSFREACAFRHTSFASALENEKVKPDSDVQLQSQATSMPAVWSREEEPTTLSDDWRRYSVMFHPELLHEQLHMHPFMHMLLSSTLPSMDGRKTNAAPAVAWATARSATDRSSLRVLWPVAVATTHRFGSEAQAHAEAKCVL